MGLGWVQWIQLQLEPGDEHKVLSQIPDGNSEPKQSIETSGTFGVEKCHCAIQGPLATPLLPPKPEVCSTPIIFILGTLAYPFSWGVYTCLTCQPQAQDPNVDTGG